MKKLKILLLSLLSISLFISACGKQSSLSPEGDEPLNGTSITNGKWVEQKLDAILSEGPDFTINDNYNDLAISDYELIAEQKNVPLIWAMEKSLSPSKEYGLFNSNRDCIESITSTSIFLKNMKTGEETSRLTGDETFSYALLDWWLDDTRFVFVKSDKDGERIYGICNVNGEVTLPKSLKDTTIILQHSGSHFVSHEYGEEKTIDFSKIGKDNQVEGIGRFSSDNYIMDAAISPDLRFIALKTRDNYETGHRILEILDTTDGSFYKIEPPIIQNALEVALISLNWESTYLRASYDVKYVNEDKFELYEYQF